MKSESRVPLLENDHLEKTTEDQDKDGFSSGYDSSQDVSDTEIVPGKQEKTYLTCDRGADSESEDDSAEVLSYKSTSALCEHLKYIVSMPELCDVTFLVGPTRVPVYGVKAILCTRSRVLYQLILNRQHRPEVEKSTMKRSRKSTTSSHVIIDVNKYEPEDFRMILQFVHCGIADIGIHNVAGLLCGAYQFGLDDLRSACWDYVRRTLVTDPGLKPALMVAACRYSRHKAARKLISKMEQFLQEAERETLNTQIQEKPVRVSSKSTTV